MKAKLSIYSQLNYLPWTAIEMTLKAKESFSSIEKLVV